MKKRKLGLLALVAGFAVLGLLNSVHAREGVDPFEEGIFFTKRVLYAFWSYEKAREGINYMLDHFEEFIVLNPNPDSEEIKRPLGYFISFMGLLYALSIATTGFYLLFISGSPKGRSKAKSLISTLIAGMLVTSMSPLILKFFMDSSSAATKMVLGQTNTKVVTTNLQNTFGRAGLEHTPPSTAIAQIHTLVTFVEIELGYYTFLPVMLVVWGCLVLFSIRFLALTLFIILFPLAVFFYSFHTTKDVGRNMLEELISWTLIQVFNAFVMAAIALTLLQTPEGTMQLKTGLGVPVFLTTFNAGLITFEIIPFIGCFVMGLAPIFILRLFRNFLP